MDFDLFYFLEKNTFQGFILFVQLLLLLLFAWFTGDTQRERESLMTTLAMVMGSPSKEMDIDRLLQSGTKHCKAQSGFFCRNGLSFDQCRIEKKTEKAANENFNNFQFIF